MDFDLDDPLDDILKSDGSNDSFFESDIRKDLNKSTQSKNDPKTKMNDLFGIKSGGPPDQNNITKQSNSFESLITDSMKKVGACPNIRNLATRKPENPKQTAEIKPPTSKKNDILFDDKDLGVDLGFDPKKPKVKTNILDDLLAPTPKLTAKEHSKLNTVVTIANKNERPTKPISRQPTFEQIDVNENDANQQTNYSLSLPRPRPRTARSETNSSVNDPLGIFSRKEEDQLKKKETDDKIEEKYNWLGLSNIKRVESNTKLLSAKVNNESIQNIQSHESNIDSVAQNSKSELSHSAFLITNTNLETENAVQSLNQQESQLEITKQIKSQEAILLDMQKRQKELLAQQESQFNLLLQNQLKKQHFLEENLKSQHERINSHIQLLMTQPVSLPNQLENSFTITNKSIENGEKKEVNMQSTFKQVEFELDIKKLELEKLHLEDIISNVQANHEKEIVLIEQSHKKQMALLEDNLSSLESRLKSENENLKDFYLKKIQTLEKEKDTLVKNHAQNMKGTVEQHDLVVEQLKTKHKDDLINIQADHHNMIDHIRQSKLLEFSILQENSSYLDTLKAASNYLENASGNLQTLKETLEERIGIVNRDKERELQLREKRIEEQQKQLDRIKSETDQERIHLIELVKTLEFKINSVTQTTSEEQWSLRQKLASLEAEKSAFERERDFVREQQLRDEKRIEDLKQTTILEHQRLLRQIEEERQFVATEKLKWQTLEKLQKPSDQNAGSHAEIDAAIKIAQDAAHQADQERERLLVIQRQFEIKRRELIDQENELKMRQSNLEIVTNAAQAREKIAENVVQSVKAAEQKIILKYQDLMKNTKELNDKEERISLEKLELSKQRLEVQQMRQNLANSKCSLCRIGQKSQEVTDLLSKVVNGSVPYQERDYYLDTDFTDRINRKSVELTDRNYELDLENIPNITDTADSLLDPDLLLLKFDVLNSQKF